MAARTPGEKPAQGRASSPTQVSDKQIFCQVRDGRQCTFHLGLPALPSVTGYVAGMDRYHWLVISSGFGVSTREVEKFLVHKASAVVQLHDDTRIEGESLPVQNAVQPYRDWVLRNFFKRIPSGPVRPEAE